MRKPHGWCAKTSAPNMTLTWPCLIAFAVVISLFANIKIHFSKCFKNYFPISLGKRTKLSKFHKNKMATCGLSGGLLNAPFFKPLRYIHKYNVIESICKKFPSTHGVFPVLSCFYVPVKGSRLAIVWD